ncbi:UNVERIFIED_CONTAM: hypothetical protein RMT77_000008 [Armadillidium vulgare]
MKYFAKILLFCIIFSKIYFLKTENDSESEKKSCGNDNKCGSQFCCVIGFNRFSFPRCSPLGDVGEWCRAKNASLSYDLAYPNNLTIHLPEAYIGFCPCKSDLVCSKEGSQCEKIQK